MRIRSNAPALFQALIFSMVVAAFGAGGEPPAKASAQNEKLPWSPEQATGAPDTPKAGDYPTAWASLEQDAGEEWLELEYERAVTIASVVIHETFNPGAVSKVSAFDAQGNEVLLRKGRDPTRQVPGRPRQLLVTAASPVESLKVRVWLDSAQVQGWNEIDAVELVGADGSRQWAVKASASSTYASLSSKPPVEYTIEGMPPSVVTTLPQAGATDVDPEATKEILVQFSKEMMTEKMWSVVQVSKENFPEVNGDIEYLDDKRTCAIPVKLQPGTTYVMWFNSGRYNSFRDKDNHPAVPYMLVFKTKGEPKPQASATRPAGTRVEWVSDLYRMKQ